MVCERCYKPNDVGEHGLGLCPLEARRDVASVIGDDIPGGLEMPHGICHEDGTPRKFYSRSEIRKACAERGMVWGPDAKATPKAVEARERLRERQENLRRGREVHR